MKKSNKKKQEAFLDPHEWEEWVRQHAAKLLLFARQQTRSHQDAEDILQEAFLKLSQKLQEGSFEGSQEFWLGYIYTTLRRLAIDLGRRNDRRIRREEKSQTLDESHNQEEDPWFDTHAADEEMRKLLEEGLRLLPKKFSEIIVMKIWGERTFAEIGEVLGVSLNTAASRYRYGLQSLRKYFESHRRQGDL